MLVPAGLVAAVVLAAEGRHALAARRGLGDRPGPGRTEVVVVLGYRNRGSRPNLVNRYRVRAGLRSIDPAADTLLVFCGGAVAGPFPEADLMATYALSLGYRGPVATETTSRSTEENLLNVIPLLGEADRIKIVSDPVHAEAARERLHQLRPDLGRRIAASSEYRFGEHFWIKPIVVTLAWRARRTTQDPDGSILRCGRTLPDDAQRAMEAAAPAR